MSIYQPYTYLIGWTKYNIWYYGARWAKGCHPNDLWVTYFTSSKEVKKYRKLYGEPDIVEIRRISDCGKKIRLWEEKVQRRLNVVKNSKWLNKQYGGVKFCSDGDPETGRRISNSLKGKSPPNKGKRMSDHQRMLFIGENNPMYGKKPWNKGLTKESSDIIKKGSEKLKGRKRKDLSSYNINNKSIKWIITFPDGHEEEIINMAEFCKMYNLSKSNLHKTYKGKAISHKGYRAKKLS